MIFWTFFRNPFDNILSIEVQSYDVILKTNDGKQHRLEVIIPDLVLDLPKPSYLELWNNNSKVQSHAGSFHSGPVLYINQ